MISAGELRSSLVWTAAALAPLALLALTLGFCFTPEALEDGAPWRALGLVPPGCPGCSMCGMSRAFGALGHGRLEEALTFHPAVLAIWPLAWLVALGGPLALVRTLLNRRRTWRSPH